MTTVAEPEEILAPVPPRRLIVSVYGLYARERGGALSVSSLVRLLGGLGVDSQAVRSAVSRLKRRGLLEPQKVGGDAGYRLSAALADVLAEGDERIFSRRRAGAGEGWLLVAFSVPESARDQRHQLRSLLIRLGLGTVAPGLWVAPAHLEAEVSHALDRAGLRGYTELFRSRHVAGRPLRETVASWWDLDALAAQYSAFVARHEPVMRAWRDADGTAEQAFADYVTLVTVWRRLPYLDPGLPLEALPENWVGDRAEDLFGDLRARLAGPAREHVSSVLDA
ncbi:putative membrane protein [Pseudonocardia sp. Ae406_Ps2]|uniref:PaaX family transcriptional regulator n=1 Tax=unclassified Pseudonocardia TaxID=2619320 RepID=UPI00094B4153|nr:MULTISPECIES: PaaX family transcriptional regulator C-terminal domain-containing protein [unclassified Pseudonocardia]OLM02032.1 putative membrane protein [Pseudonocardia sp. Ae406_Ps2]OLM06184.1 putative membrane protein [Pseudonocardia sp. Ae331_Ps2]OLM23607.1 putative membrane protein [Pseudonocardia sp. Ae706_Ps2]